MTCIKVDTKEQKVDYPTKGFLTEENFEYYCFLTKKHCKKASNWWKGELKYHLPRVGNCISGFELDITIENHFSVKEGTSRIPPTHCILAYKKYMINVALQINWTASGIKFYLKLYTLADWNNCYQHCSTNWCRRLHQIQYYQHTGICD